MESQPVPPEECLRSLTAAAWLRAFPGHDLLPDSLGVMAAANALVMLGLVAEARADEILAEHRAALEAKGVNPGRGVNAGELTVRPGAHEYWAARGDSVAALTDLPLRVLPAGVRLTATLPGQPAEICVEWLTLTRSGWRMTYRASGSRAKAEPETAGAPGLPRAAAEQLLAQVAVADDIGHRYELTRGGGGGWGRAGPDGWELHGVAATDPNLLGQPGWLEFRSPGTTATGTTAVGERVRIQPPPDVPVGTAEPPWPTPAEAFTEHLARIDGFNLNGSELTPDQTAGIVATVADCLLAVGALPASSPLLREPRAGGRGWQRQLAERWSGRAYQQAAVFRAPEHRGLAAELPLKHATAVIESVSARGGLVIVRLYGHPWVTGEYWPMIAPCFTVAATDENGNSYQGMPRSWHGGTSHQGSGEFWFWPPVPEACERLTVTVSTLWESAWADVDLPGRTT